MNPLNDNSSKAGSHSSLFIQSILDSLLANVVVIDNTGKIALVNKQWEEFGLKNGLDIQIEWIGTDYFEIIKRAFGISVDGIKEIHDGVKKVLSGRQDHFELEYPCYGRDQEHWIRMHVNGFIFGKEKWVTISHLDITEQKKAEEVRYRTEEFFRTTFEQAAVGIAHVSQDGTFLRINQTFCNIVGYSREEMLGQTFQDITHPDDLKADLEQVALLLEGKKNTYSIEKRYFHKDGSTVWVKLTVSLVWDLSGKPDYFVSVIENIDRRKQAEESLRKSEEGFRNLMEQSPLSIQIHTPDGKLYKSNAAYEKLYGFSKETLAELYEKYNVLLDDQAKERGLMPYIERVFSREIVSFPECEYDGVDTLKTLDFNKPVSRKCWIRTHGFPIMDEDGTVNYAVFISEDFTARKKAEEQSIESEKSYRSLIEQARDGIVLVQDGRITYANSAMVAITGRVLDEIIDHPFEEFLADDQLEKVKEIYKKRMNNEPVPSIYESAIKHKNGTRVEAEFNAGLTIFMEKPADLVIVRDIRERKKAEEERNRIFNLSTDLVGIAGFDGRFRQINPAWPQVLGYSLDKIMARPFQDFVHMDDRNKTQAEVEKLASGHITIDFENRYIHKDGSFRHISWTATPLVEEGQFYCIGRDITERKKVEEQILNYQQRLKDLAAELTISEERQHKLIAANLHDNVGQLLASSRIQLAALNDTMSKTEVLSKIDNISTGLLQAIQSTRDVIFDLSPPQLNEIGLFAATADWMEEQIELKHGLKTSITGDDRVYFMDNNIRFLLFRSIRELLINVVKHAKASQVSVDITETEKNLEISVGDNGTGFHYNPAMLRLKSFGFGLFSIQERVSNNGGYMSIETSPGEGTLIKLIVPLYP